MKNILKKNQVIIFTIALMLIVAGYMNYTVNTEHTLKTAALSDEEKYADLGDAQLVSSINVEENNTETAKQNETVQESSTVNDEEKNSTVQDPNDNSLPTIANEQIKSTDEYFTQSKLDRDTMYSQMLESYQKILNNDQISDTQKSIAQEEIKNINNKKNAIMIAENLIKNKGFANVMIFINDKNADIIVKSNDLKPEQIAQIQNIVQRELNVEIENIHISTKA